MKSTINSLCLALQQEAIALWTASQHVDKIGTTSAGELQKLAKMAAFEADDLANKLHCERFPRKGLGIFRVRRAE